MSKPCPYSRPTIFSPVMVRALLDKKKDQTRRLITAPLVKWLLKEICDDPKTLIECITTTGDIPLVLQKGFKPKEPRFLWVKENFGYEIRNLGGTPHEQAAFQASKPNAARCYDCNGNEQPMKWKPSIHMPRHVNRLTLPITYFRIERLTDISDDDAVAEGIDWSDPRFNWPNGHSGGGFFDYLNPDEGDYSLNAKDSYKSLWKALHGKESWNDQQYVGIFHFDVQQKNIDMVLRDGGLKAGA